MNSYRNIFTRLAAMWIDNDYALKQKVKLKLSRSETVSELAANIQKVVWDGLPQTGSCLYSDLLYHAAAEIDYEEIAYNIWERRR